MTDDDKQFVATAEKHPLRSEVIDRLCRIIRELEGDLQELVSLRAQYFKLAEIYDEKHRDLSWQTHFRKEARDEANALQAHNAKLRAALEEISRLKVGWDNAATDIANAALEDGNTVCWKI